MSNMNEKILVSKRLFEIMFEEYGEPIKERYYYSDALMPQGKSPPPQWCGLSPRKGKLLIVIDEENEENERI